MKLPALLMSDPHFTANPRDEYRWGIWKWLEDQSADGYFKTLVIAGDLTDAKDYHSATLVNRIVGVIHAASKRFEEVVILQGNHDYLKEGHAYFSFLNLIPNVRFITKPTEMMQDDGPATMFLPYSKNPAKDWAGWDFSHYELLFLHQTVKGAIASNGQAMDGEELPPLNALKVYSGDIHVPQKIGPVEYIGSPYHVHFGDAFTPRCIELDRKGKAHDLHFETIRRLRLDILPDDESAIQYTKPGDQVKVRIHLTQADKHRWSALKRETLTWLEGRGLIVEGIEMELERPRRRLIDPGASSPLPVARTPSDALLRFVEAEDLGAEALDVGLELL